MAQKKKRPGSAKGEPKPKRRELDLEFPARLRQAMGDRSVPDVARAIGCERATLHNYLNGANKTIESLLLFKLADEIGVAARWLLTGQGAKGGLTVDELAVAMRYRRGDDDEKALIRSLLDRMSGSARG